MNGIIHYETFLLTGILLNLTPGNDTIFILGRSMALGKKAGIVSALGVGTGSLIHTTLAAFGLSLIIAKSPLLFSIIKYAGAAYLLYVGIKMIIRQSGLMLHSSAASTATPLKIIYRDAIVTNVLNPKVALFFIAFLPQFIDAGCRNSVLPLFILGFSFTITGTIWCMMLALFASQLFRRLRNDQKISSRLNKVCGITLIALGIKVAFATRR